MSAPITITGRLGADPELKVSSNGSALATFRMVSNGRRMVEGTWEDTDTTWWSVTAFGRTAEAVASSCTKGQQIVVIGKVKAREWEKDGVKQTRMEVVADTVATVVRLNENAVNPGPAAQQANPWGPEPF